MSLTRSWSTARPGSICATRPSCFAPRTIAGGWRSSWRAATSRSSNMAGSNFSRRHTSRTCWQSCAGRKTRGTPSPVFAFCNCCRGSGRPAQRRRWRISASTGSTSASLLVSHPRMRRRLRDTATAWAGQVSLVRAWYQPHLERLYDYAPSRAGDLDQLEQIAMGYPNRERFLSEVTLDPPDATGAEAGLPGLDEDYLILSTIHSAKGQEWDAVYVLNLVDGCIPSDMASGKPEQIDEERRLLYVAMTRAREHLHLLQPSHFYH